MICLEVDNVILSTLNVKSLFVVSLYLISIVFPSSYLILMTNPVGSYFSPSVYVDFGRVFIEIE